MGMKQVIRTGQNSTPRHANTLNESWKNWHTWQRCGHHPAC